MEFYTRCMYVCVCVGLCLNAEGESKSILQAETVKTNDGKQIEREC